METTVTAGRRPATPAKKTSALAPTGLIGGIGGIAFVATVLLQNVLRASAPAADASAASVTAYYRDHHGTVAVLTPLFVIGAIGLATFTAAVLVRTVSSNARGPALAGAIGVTGVFALFASSFAVDLAGSAFARRPHPDPEVVAGLWNVHNAVFGLLLVAIGIALAGLSAAAATTGLVASAWKAVGLLGGIALAVTGAATPAVLEGSPIMALGLLGFLSWLVFVVVASVGLLRGRATSV